MRRESTLSVLFLVTKNRYMSVRFDREHTGGRLLLAEL